MPARIRKIRHDEDTRLRIKVGNIINRLQKHFDGEIELSASQIKTAELLLRKTLPDLTSVEHSGEIATRSVIRAPLPAKDAAEWNTTLSGSLKTDPKLHS